MYFVERFVRKFGSMSAPEQKYITEAVFANKKLTKVK
jgi:hypothetical protein